MNPRLRKLCDLSVPVSREIGGRHEYDGQIQDLSITGVRDALAGLGGDPLDDPHDEAHVVAFEEGARVTFGEAELHRHDPVAHVFNMDLASYDKLYAPEGERAAARQRHLALWPEAADMAVTALDQVPAPVAEGTLDAVRGLAAGLREGRSDVEDAALRAHARFVAHLEKVAQDGPPDVALGGPILARILGAPEAAEVDLDALGRQADSERDRLRAMLDEACAAHSPGTPTAEVVRELVRDHPDADGVLDDARALTEELIAWTRDTKMAPYHDGTCVVTPAPESRRWAMAMMSWCAPGEVPGPSYYHVTPPDTAWPKEQQEEWLQVFSRTTLPAITVHEVAPGHYSHGIALRHAPTEARRLLQSNSFAEGWAHYVEEVAVEEGFHGDDPRFAAGVAIEALIRVTRLACSIGLHTGAMTVADATERFERDAFLAGPAALSEARRGTFDPGYGRYTWGKLVIRDLRERAKAEWGDGFSLPRLHAAMLDLGSPPLGLLGTAVERG